METRYISLSLETAKRWYEQGGELKDMALGVYTLEEMGFELPKTFEEYLEILDHWRIIRHKEEYEDLNPQIAAVKKLILLRDFYNNRWQPEWGDYIVDKYAIDKDYKTDTGTFEYSLVRVYRPSSFLVFNNHEHAEEFLNNFRELIVEAGDLI